MKAFYKSIIGLSICLTIVLHVGLIPAHAEDFSVNKERFVSIDFNNVEITVFIKFISELTGINFVIDNRVKGKITVISPSKISISEAFKVFESVLEVHDYTTVKAGKIVKVVPMTDARTKNIELKLRQESASPEDKIVTQLIPLKYADPDEVKRLFSPFVSKSSVIQAYGPTNTLIITDVYSNIQRLLKIIKTIDVTGIGREITIIPLKSADATKLIKVLETVFKPNAKSKRRRRTGTDRDIQFVADDRTNSLVILANRGDIERVSELIAMLDKEVPKGKEKFHVYYLENATAEDLVSVLQAIPQQAGKQPASKKGAKRVASPVISSDVKISADKATNSLIIMADKDDYLVLEDIIKKLDIPRSMVYIECLIMEVNTARNFNLGVEWTVGEEATVKGKEGAIVSGWSGDNYNNSKSIMGLSEKSLSTSTTRTSSMPNNFSVGVFAAPFTVNAGGAKVMVPTVGALVNAVKGDEDYNILSTPQILTTDNQEASITVGENMPFETQASVTEGITTSNYEYKDVGVTLKITPQISKGGRIRLKIFQESSRLVDAGQQGTQPTTLKRTFDTTVVVDDANTVVIGGLIDESSTRTSSKVPCLGDIPILGWLFSSMGKSNTDRNLYVFITPRVVNSTEAIKEMYRSKRDEMNKLTRESIKLYKSNDEKSDSITNKIRDNVNEWIVP